MDAIKKIQELYGLTIEIPKRLETENDLIREAQAVIDYWESKTVGWIEKPCKQCNRLFAYRWDSTAIAYCSIRCASIYLENIGLKWDSTKPLEERWGRTVPAVVPPEVLDILQDLVDIPEALLDNIINE